MKKKSHQIALRCKPSYTTFECKGYCCGNIHKLCSDTCLSSFQDGHKINKTYPTQVFHNICRLQFSASHTLLRVCPWVCQISISLASLSVHPLFLLPEKPHLPPSSHSLQPPLTFHTISCCFSPFTSPLISSTQGLRLLGLIPALVSVFYLFLQTQTGKKRVLVC